MRGFFILLFKTGEVVIARKKINHDVVIKDLNLNWKDNNIKWLRGTMVPSVDESSIQIKDWWFKPVDPPWWYLRNKTWYDDMVLKKFDEDFLQRVKRIGIAKAML